MEEYTYNIFFNTLDKTGQTFMDAINEYIGIHYSDYKPLDIKPTDKSKREWRLDYRKKAKVGKAICSFYSVDGKLSVRFSFLTSMVREFLIRQNEFTDEFRKIILKQIICVVNKKCRNYGGNISCQFTQYYWIDNRFLITCPYPWIYISGLDENDIMNLKLLVDLQMNNMVQDKKEIKGNTYHELNMQRCKNVQIINLNGIDLDTNQVEAYNLIKKNMRLEKYISLYNLIPMGGNAGLWFYQSNQYINGLNCKKNECLQYEIPKGRYATVLIDNPFTFSLNRIWNYICQWMKDNKEFINGFPLKNNDNTACFVKIFIRDLKEFMEVYVPIK